MGSGEPTQPDKRVEAEITRNISDDSAVSEEFVFEMGLEEKAMQIVLPDHPAPPQPPVPHPPRPGLLIFAPHRMVDVVPEILPADLVQQGIRGVILDLDNTLVLWQREEIAEEVLNWIEALKAAGVKLCILSNSLLGQRSVRIAERIGGHYVRRARKPSKTGFQRAMALMETIPETTAIVGDQMFTDIWGGNRAGIYTILVQPIHPREFVYTRYVSRPPERFLLRYFRKRGHL